MVFPLIVKDQMGFTHHFKQYPQRIVSLVPSQTELLIDLGLKDRLVGRTKFCIHPKQILASIPSVGGTKNFHLDRIKTINPDLIIGNKEENDQTLIEKLKLDYTVWMSDIENMTDALKMIVQVGEITGFQDKSNEIVGEIEKEISRINHISNKISKSQSPSCIYLIWKDPWIAVGHSTFIHNMLELCHFNNVASHLARYPEISMQEMQLLKPDYIFLSSEPYPFKEKNVVELQKIFHDSKIVLVDGEMFSWYGSRLMKSLPYFQELINELP